MAAWRLLACLAIVGGFSSAYCQNVSDFDVELGNLTAPIVGVYKVLRTVPHTLDQLRYLQQLQHQDEHMHLNFWKAPVNVNNAVDVMVSETRLTNLKDALAKRNLPYTIIIEDVEKLIIQRERKELKSGDFDRRFRDDRNEPLYDFHSYGSYAQMEAYMRSLARKYAKFVQFISIGKTHEGRSIDGLEIGTRGHKKRVFWIDGGIHAREWAASHTALFFIHQLTSKYGRDANITSYVDDITWIIVPCLNPDGYEFTRSSTNPNIRLWRKNRSPTACLRDQWGRNRCCKGVDLNRNFDFHFKESGSSDDPCSEIYQGTGPFSEPESKAVRDAILSSRYRNRVDGFITLHTYSQLWIHPYGHKRDSYPGDVQELLNVGKKATNALRRLYGTKYVVGSGADTLYPASGGSEDWAKQSAAIKFVYLLELRPDEKNWDGFILEERQLIPTAAETWAGVSIVAESIIERQRRKVSAARASGIRQHRFGDGTPGSCFDLRHACKQWIRDNETLCKTVPLFMRENCAYSCEYC
uniref:ShKT domain-containing protein n=1 Tax=Panagrellus redivivus TaxID=6233 RepID=A0A7E4VCU7_PANRE